MEGAPSAFLGSRRAAMSTGGSLAIPSRSSATAPKNSARLARLRGRPAVPGTPSPRHPPSRHHRPSSSLPLGRIEGTETTIRVRRSQEDRSSVHRRDARPSRAGSGRRSPSPARPPTAGGSLARVSVLAAADRRPPILHAPVIVSSTAGRTTYRRARTRTCGFSRSRPSYSSSSAPSFDRPSPG